MLRRSAILKMLRTMEPKPTSLLDIGCGAKFFLLKALGGCDDEIPLERIYGLDIDDKLLEKAGKEITAAKLGQDEEKGDRWRGLEYNILHGSFEGLTKDMVGGAIDVVVSCELVQHLHDQTLEKLPKVVLGELKPEIWIVTTVNREFSALYDVPLPMDFGLLDEMTDDQKKSGFGITEKGHKFEWDRKEFQDWCQQAGSKWGYQLEVSEVGTVKQGLCFGEVEEEAAMVEDSLKSALGLEGEMDRDALIEEARKRWGSRTQVVVFKKMETVEMQEVENFVEISHSSQTTFLKDIKNLTRSTPTIDTVKPLFLDSAFDLATLRTSLADTINIDRLLGRTCSVHSPPPPTLIHTLQMPRAQTCLPYPPTPSLTASLLASSLLPLLPERLSLFWTDPGHALRLEPAEAWNKYDSARDRRHAEQLQGMDMAAIRTVRRLVGCSEVWKSAGSVRRGWRWKEEEWRRFVEEIGARVGEEWVFDERDFRGLRGEREVVDEADGTEALVSQGGAMDEKVEERRSESPYSTGSLESRVTYAKGEYLFSSAIDPNTSCLSDYDLPVGEATIPSSSTRPKVRQSHGHDLSSQLEGIESRLEIREISSTIEDVCFDEDPENDFEYDRQHHDYPNDDPKDDSNDEYDFPDKYSEITIDFTTLDPPAPRSSPPERYTYEALEEGISLPKEESHPEEDEVDNASEYSYQLTIPTWETVPLVSKLTATLRFISPNYTPPPPPINAPANDQTLIYDTRPITEHGEKEAGIEVVFRLKEKFWFDDFLGEGVVTAPEGELGRWVRVGEEAGGRWEWVD